MPRDFEREVKRTLESIQQWEIDEEQMRKKLSDIEFDSTAPPDLEGYEKTTRAQNQAPLDMLAELKAINQRLDLAEEGSRKQAAENRIWQAVSITIGLLTLGATILFGILALLR
ncbi:MAG: hypothetical protein HFF19_00945 [Oscillospiraceae bacterium]|jgi:hypothetical protein|nr:hypothetical protein [Oscillospiraceae bacterium]